jgi:hypothetical protein
MDTQYTGRHWLNLPLPWLLIDDFVTAKYVVTVYREVTEITTIILKYQL